MPGLLGNIIVIAVLVLVVAICLKQIAGDMKGGSCAGCGGSCAGCSKAKLTEENSVVDEAKASEILEGIRKPSKI